MTCYKTSASRVAAFRYNMEHIRQCPFSGFSSRPFSIVTLLIGPVVMLQTTIIPV
jgi:hypothetical protein